MRGAINCELLKLLWGWGGGGRGQGGGSRYSDLLRARRSWILAFVRAEDCLFSLSFRSKRETQPYFFTMKIGRSVTLATKPHSVLSLK